MRGSSAMKLISACCGGLLTSVPVDAGKKFYDYRTGNDYDTQKANCENAVKDKTRYIQVELFDYNLTPWIKATYRQIADECGGSNFTPYSATMEYNGNLEGNNDDNRLQMDMYICAPFGQYELEVEVKSTNGNKAMERVAWEIEYGPDEYHIWDTLNTPFFGNEGPEFKANGATPADYPYAPIPSGDGKGTTYKWPLDGSEGYYSVLYTGPFPPNHCPNLYPPGVAYEGCYPKQSGWTTPTTPGGPTGSKNTKDPAERYRMFDGLGSGDDGVDESGVMTLEKCAGICSGYSYMGLQSAIQCLCGNSISGKSVENCGLADDNQIPEYKYLCSGDSRVLCGTDTKVSIYSLDGTGPTPTPPTPTPPTPTPPTPTPGDGYELQGCSEDDKDDRVMSLGPITLDTMSAEICFNYCIDEDQGYTYFGTEYAEECFCSKTLPNNLDLKHSECTTECENNAGEICGGTNAISVYKIGDAGPTPTPPTPTPPTPTPPTPTPPTPTPGDGYELQGCSEDDKNDRVMTLGPITLDTMSAEICFNYCIDEDQGYTYFGTEYAEECFCSKTVANNLDLKHSECTTECENNAGEICGGTNAISVYKIGDAGPTPTPPTPTPPTPTPPTPTPPTPTPPTPTPGDGYELQGCSEDDKDDRVMTLGPISLDTMSAEICFNYCMDENQGYTYFGTEYAEECFCSKTVANNLDLKHSECTTECKNNAGEICGGTNAISVYKIGDTGPTPTPPTPTPPTPTPPTPTPPTPTPPTPTPPTPTPPTPTPTPGDGYDSLGCFADNQPDESGEKARIMGSKTSSGSMTAEACFKACNVGTNTHFGTQWGKECWCVEDPKRDSIDRFDDVALPCDYECTGDATETCGGVDAMTVYVITDAADPPAPGPTPADEPTPASEPYTKKDCYVDLRDGSRVMEFQTDTSSGTTMSAQICYEMCTDANAGYTYFGLQYGHECWCSTTFSDSETTDGATCDYECSNNPDETCGGFDAVMAYEIN